MSRFEELTTQERAAAVTVWVLQNRDGIRTDEVAEKLGMTRGGVRKILHRISSIIPVYYDEGRRVWRLIDDYRLDERGTGCVYRPQYGA